MPKTDESYQELQTELDRILNELQSVEIDPDKAVGLYEEGLKLTKRLENHLKFAENKVKQLKQTYEKG